MKNTFAFGLPSQIKKLAAGAMFFNM